jgi:integrase
MLDGPAPEPDLDVILPLLNPATFAQVGTWKTAHPPWAAHRDVAVVALCWIVGLRPSQIEHVRRRDWRPGGHILRAPGLGRYEGVRDRDLPVLAPARDAIGAYLRACLLPMPADGPLILRADGVGFAQHDASPLDARIKKATAGRIGGLGVLTGRYRLYIERTMAVDGTVERLVGRTGVYDHLDPGPKRLRRALEEAHPVGRGLPEILD